MGTGQRTYRPRHRRTTSSFQPRTINLTRDRDQKLHNTPDWVGFRSRFLAVNPECYCCGKKSQVVDHIEPSKGREDVFERTGNHLPLCTTCHNTVTGKFDYKYTPGTDLSPKLNWIAQTRARNEILQGRKFPAAKVIRYREGTG